jgi:V/A-type H+/Na+-transporting ATPase subunit C
MRPVQLDNRSKPDRGRDYGYSNARVRGMKSRLLSKSFFDQFMECPDLNATIRALSETEYGPDLESKLLHGQTFAAVDDALKTNMVRTYQKVLKVVNGEGRFIVSTMLGRWDLFDIKTILRGKHMHLEPERIVESLIAAGEFTPVELDALAQLEDVRSVVDTIAIWGVPYAAPLRKVMRQYVASDNLAVLELALDSYYAEWASQRLRNRRQNYQLAARVFAAQTDSTNLVTAFRLLKADMEGEDKVALFLPGGKDVSLDLFRQLTSLSDIDEVLDRLKRTPYGQSLEGASLSYIETGSIAVLERVLEDYVVRRALATSHADPLGAGVLISYLWAKQNEVTNLRIIVKGTSVGMPPDRMRGELIVV